MALNLYHGFREFVGAIEKTDLETLKDHVDRLSNSLCTLGIATIGLAYYQPVIRGEGSTAWVWVGVGFTLYVIGYLVVEQKRRLRTAQHEEQDDAS